MSDVRVGCERYRSTVQDDTNLLVHLAIVAGGQQWGSYLGIKYEPQNATDVRVI